jgi:hypothetical protein
MSFRRRASASVLLFLWLQVATANALPCAISCLLEESVVHHHHAAGDEDHPIGHHVSGAKISAPQSCGTPQLMVVAFAPPQFPTPPSVTVVTIQMHVASPAFMLSATPEFGTPPPRA